MRIQHATWLALVCLISIIRTVDRTLGIAPPAASMPFLIGRNTCVTQ